MTLSLPPWRERPLERGEEGEKGNVRLLDALVEAWNRELTPLLRALRLAILNAVGFTVTLDFSDSPHTAESTTKFYRIDATDGEFTFKLRPSADALEDGVQYFIVKKLDSSANAVVITAVDGDDIDGAPPAPLTSQFESVELWVREDGYDIA